MSSQEQAQQEAAEEDVALSAAEAALQDAEAAVLAARKAHQGARHVRDHRADRTKMHCQELARAQGAIRSAQAVRDREKGQRDALHFSDVTAVA